MHAGLPEGHFLSENGNLPVFKVGGPVVKFIQRLASDFFAAGMLNNLK
jgi:hypothetical protein